MVVILNKTNPKDLKQQKNDVYKPLSWYAAGGPWENIRSGDLVSKGEVLDWIKNDHASIIKS